MPNKIVQPVDSAAIRALVREIHSRATRLEAIGHLLDREDSGEIEVSGLQQATKSLDSIDNFIADCKEKIGG